MKKKYAIVITVAFVLLLISGAAVYLVRQLGNNGKSAMKDWSRDQAIGFKSMEEITAILADLPDNYDAIMQRADLFVIRHGKTEQGEVLWEGFTTAVEQGKQTSIVIVQFTTEDDPIYYFLEYNGESYHCVKDYTRDYFSAGEGYEEGIADTLDIETDEQEDGIVEEKVYLVGEEELRDSSAWQIYSRILE